MHSLQSGKWTPLELTGDNIIVILVYTLQGYTNSDSLKQFHFFCGCFYRKSEKDQMSNQAR